MNKPETKFRAGTITATIWKNTSQKGGEEKEYKTVTFERSYKDKSDEWKTTNSMMVSDLPKAMVVLGKAYEYLTLSPQEESAA